MHICSCNVNDLNVSSAAFGNIWWSPGPSCSNVLHYSVDSAIHFLNSCLLDSDFIHWIVLSTV